MELTTASRWWPDSRTRLDIFLLPGIVEAAEHLVQQHVGEADDRVQRRAQFVADSREEPALCKFHALRGVCRDSERGAQFRRLIVRPEDGCDFPIRARRSRHLDLERPVVPHDASVDRTGYPKPDVHAFEIAALAKIGERRHVDDPVGDMHAVEQPAGKQEFGSHAEDFSRLMRRVGDVAGIGHAQHDAVDDLVQPRSWLSLAADTASSSHAITRGMTKPA